MEKRWGRRGGEEGGRRGDQAIVQGIGEDGGLLVPDFDFTKMDLDVSFPLFIPLCDLNYCIQFIYISQYILIITYQSKITLIISIIIDYH